MTESISEIITATKTVNRAALIGYVTAGFPDLSASVAQVKTMVENGCNVIEVGIPYTDPAMDGPVIQTTSKAALHNGFRVSEVFTVVEAVAQAGGMPVVMSYYNPVLQYGLQRFAKDIYAAGGRGSIVPDLALEESQIWEDLSANSGLETVFLAAPASPAERLQEICARSTGFVYAVARMGVTGVQASLSHQAEELVAKLRYHKAKNVCVGIGVSNAQHANEVAGYADGVIVGSAFLATLLTDKPFGKRLEDLGQIVRSIKQGLCAIKDNN